MADEKPQPKVLKGEDALTLARQGKEAWNAWAEDEANAGTEVDFSGHDFTDNPVSFGGFVFPGRVMFVFCIFKNAKFSHANFKGGFAFFDNAKFSGKESLFIGTQFIGGLASFLDTTFSGGAAQFDKATFSGGGWFGRAKFIDSNARFDGTTFGGEGALFNEVEFSRDASFKATGFSKAALFVGAKFHGSANFSESVYGDAVNFESASFHSVPDFRRTKLSAHFTLHDMKVGYRENKKCARWLGLSWAKAEYASDVDKYRRLKELAITAKDHDREQDFFAGELKAKRFYETTGAALVWSYLYEWFSDFGRSVYRPLVSLYATVVAFGFIYWLAALFSTSGLQKSLDNGLKLSAAALLPFVAAARTSYGEAKTALFGAHAGLWLDVLVIGEGILGLAFAFLIGLALRNRFRI